MCVYASSFATAIVLLSKISGRERNLNVYLTWLWLIRNWAYSTLLPFLCLCVSFIHHALFSPSYAPRWLGGQYTISWWKEKPPPASNWRIFAYNLELPSRLHAERTSLNLKPSPCPPHHNFTHMTFEEGEGLEDFHHVICRWHSIQHYINCMCVSDCR